MLVVMVMLVVVLVVGVVVLVMMMLLVVVMLVLVVVVAVHNRGSSPISLLWARKEKSLGGEMDPKSGKVLMGNGHFPETWWKTRLTSISPNRSISNIFSAPLLQHVNTLMKEGKCKKYEMQEKNHLQAKSGKCVRLREEMRRLLFYCFTLTNNSARKYQ